MSGRHAKRLLIDFMLILLVSLIALALVAATLALFSKGDGQPRAAAPTCATCDGHDGRCEQECQMEAATRAPEYFDDEHLDRYRHRPSDRYSDEEVGEFADVLYTLCPSDVKPWSRSLVVRGINIPDPLKDELIALMS